MHVVVVGCGRVGSRLALEMEDAGHSVAVVDRSRVAFDRLGKGFAGPRVVGIGFDQDVLRQAGVEEADALAAVTSGDNSNILAARVARERFGVEKVVARIYDPRRAAIYERLGIPTVATVAWTSDRILRRLLPDDPGVAWTDPSARVHLVERPVPIAWVGHRCAELEQPGRLRVAAVARLGRAVVPSDDLVMQEGDVLFLSVPDDGTAELDARLEAGAGGHR